MIVKKCLIEIFKLTSFVRSLTGGFVLKGFFGFAIPGRNYVDYCCISLSGLPELLAVSDCGRRLAVAGRSAESASELVCYQLPSKLLARFDQHKMRLLFWFTGVFSKLFCLVLWISKDPNLFAEFVSEIIVLILFLVFSFYKKLSSASERKL